MSSSWDKIVKLACKPKVAAPKAKYLDPIITATYSGDESLRDIFAALAVRLRDPSPVIMHKALIVIHTMIRNGDTDNVLSFLSSVVRLRPIVAFSNNGHSLSENLSSYAAYLDVRIRAYRDLKHDVIRIQGESNREARLAGGEGSRQTNGLSSSQERKLRSMAVEEGLLREVKGAQGQIDALLRCKFFLDRLDDELTTTTLRHLVKDLLILFQGENEGIINVLEHYFEMSALDAEHSLTIYKSFCTQTERVLEYLGIARKLSHLLNVPIPNLRHAPIKLAVDLEDYLRDPNFEQNRIEYMTNKALLDGRIQNKAKPQAVTVAKEESKLATFTTTKSNAAVDEKRPASIQPTIDLFEAMKVSQQTMYPTGYNLDATKESQLTTYPIGYNPLRKSTVMPQMTVMPTQPFDATFTGFIGTPSASPFAQPSYSTFEQDISGEVTLIETKPRFSGTYSDVYVGRFRNNMVAVKIIKLVNRKSLAAMRRKMLRERELWAALEHPNVAPCYGYAEDDEEKFGLFGAIISLWYEYGDAGKFLEAHGGEMDIMTRSTLWAGVISGVHYLHTYSPVIVHGDLKPGNILIDDQLNPRICDFGLARILVEGGASGLTTTSVHTGTERYLAYELVASEDMCSPTIFSDIHALGCIGFEFIYLQLPYANRISNTRGHIFFDIRNQVPPARRPSTLSESFIPLWDILDWCWRPNPEERPNTGNLFAYLENWHRSVGHGQDILMPSTALSSLPVSTLPGYPEAIVQPHTSIKNQLPLNHQPANPPQQQQTGHDYAQQVQPGSATPQDAWWEDP